MEIREEVNKAKMRCKMCWQKCWIEVEPSSFDSYRVMRRGTRKITTDLSPGKTPVVSALMIIQHCLNIPAVTPNNIFPELKLDEEMA